MDEGKVHPAWFKQDGTPLIMPEWQGTDGITSKTAFDNMAT